MPVDARLHTVLLLLLGCGFGYVLRCSIDRSTAKVSAEVWCRNRQECSGIAPPDNNTERDSNSRIFLLFGRATVPYGRYDKNVRRVVPSFPLLSLSTPER